MDLRLLILATAFLVCSNAAPTVTDEDKQYVKSVLQTVPESERKQFVIHQLYKGYVLNNPDDIAIAVPQETTQKFYELFLRDFIITPDEETVYSQLCFPNGECVDVDDPGVYP